MKKLPVNALAEFVDSLGLSPMERLLFELLLSRRGSFVSSNEINHTIVGIYDAEGGQSVDETARVLKSKLSKFSDFEFCKLEEAPSQISYMLS